MTGPGVSTEAAAVWRAEELSGRERWQLRQLLAGEYSAAGLAGPLEVAAAWNRVVLARPRKGGEIF